MNVHYENTIDTTNDMLESDRKLLVSIDTIVKDLVSSDPRIEIQHLAKSAVFYKYGTGKADENIDLDKG